MSPTRTLLVTSLAIFFMGALAIVIATPARAQSAAGELRIIMRLAQGSTALTNGATVTVDGQGPSLYGTPDPNTHHLTFTSDFSFRTATVALYPGTYNVSLPTYPGTRFTQSGDCWGTISNNTVRTCTIVANNAAPAQVTVYTNVINNGGGTKRAEDFTIAVTGNNPSLSTFRGSTGGTTLTLSNGSYTIDSVVDPGYTSSRSADCYGSISTGESRVCTITLDDTSVYQYPSSPSMLTCFPYRQTAAIGGTVTFTASGGTGIYNWVTANRSYLNAGPTLTVVQEIGSGQQSVVVSSGSQAAVCLVDVVAAGTYVSPTTYYPTYTPPAYQPYTHTAAPKTVVATSVPGLPYTGEGGNSMLTWVALGIFTIAALFFGRRLVRRITLAQL